MKGEVMTDPRKITIKVDRAKLEGVSERVKARVNARAQDLSRQMLDYAVYGEMWGVEGAIDGTCRPVPDELTTPLLPAPKEPTP
jgi:hypothetical protein